MGVCFHEWALLSTRPLDSWGQFVHKFFCRRCLEVRKVEDK